MRGGGGQIHGGRGGEGAEFILGGRWEGGTVRYVWLFKTMFVYSFNCSSYCSFYCVVILFLLMELSFV